MGKRKRRSDLAARSWSSLLDDERIQLEQRYFKALCSIAVSQTNQANIEAERNAQEPPHPTPEYDDPEDLVRDVSNGNAPEWWPKRLDRMRIMVKIRDHERSAETYGPHVHDPNTSDLGTKAFRGIVLMLCESSGDDFSGHIEIKIQTTADKRQIGGWKGEVQVGDSPRSSRGSSSSSYGDEEREAWNEYMTDQLRQKDAAMLQMFGQSSHVIHASAAALNATRGVNLAPPWMQDGEEGGSPLWMQLAGEAAKIVGGVLLNQGQAPTPGHMAGQLLQAQVHPGQSGYGQQQVQQHQPHLLTMDPTGSPPEAYDMSADGDYDGVMIEDDYLLSDEDEEQDSEEILDDEEDSGEYEGNDEEEDSDEYEDDYEDDAPKKKGNPLDGMSAQELTKHLGQYIDNHDNPEEIKKLGFQLAGKLMG